MDKALKISIRAEGGLGDCLLANRFIPAIKELYPNSEITAYTDSQGKTFQKEVLEMCYPSFYKEIKVIPNKKYKQFWVDCQFGTDNYYGALENVPDNIRAEMEGFDKFYDLHIDSLKWIDYDFDWLRYHRFFPKPQINIEKPTNKYLLLHLVSSTYGPEKRLAGGHGLEQWYIDRLIALLLEKTDLTVKVISTPEINKFYEKFRNNQRVEVLNKNIKDLVTIIGGASVMISVDSGFKYLSYGFGVPTLIFSTHCAAPFKVIPSHQTRWLIFPETCFPLNFDCVFITNLASKIIKNKGYILVPEVTEFDSQCVRRIYTINNEKTN